MIAALQQRAEARMLPGLDAAQLGEDIADLVRIDLAFLELRRVDLALATLRGARLRDALPLGVKCVEVLAPRGRERRLRVVAGEHAIEQDRDPDDASAFTQER